MPDQQCPLCGQVLPAAITPAQLEVRMQELASPAVESEKKRLQDEFDTRLIAEKEIARQRAEKELQREISEAKKRAEKAEQDRDEQVRQLQREFKEQTEIERQAAKREAERSMKREIEAAEKRAVQADADATKRIEDAKQQIEARLKKGMAQQIRLSADQAEVRLEKLQREREKERLRHEAEKAKFQGQLDNLARKLEKQSGEQLGEEGEVELYDQLRRCFPSDRIERIGKGVKGADILHTVMDGENILGRIVYESKNVSAWQNAFVNQAEKYRMQYETPHVMIVCRVFPRKEKDLCIADGVPVVRPRMAVSLAAIMREGIAEIGRLRLSSTGRDQKSQELLEYIISDRFGTRFNEVAESVEGLRNQQRKERNWHENAWELQSSLHDRIDKSHREIDAQMKAILTKKRPVAMAARA